MDSDNSPNRKKIDPDPFSVAALAISAAGLILQFLQTAHQLSQPSRTVSPLSRTPLLHLEKEVCEVREYLKRITRAVDRGSDNPESEFYEQPFRIGRSQLLLTSEWHNEFKDGVHHAYTKVGAMGLWINNIIAQDSHLTALIRVDLRNELSQTTGKLNDIIAAGRTNRELLLEVDRVLDTFEKTLSQLLNTN